jgi:SAM-dependent methyltransferase
VHVARYLFSLPYVKDQRVLDVACGTGYGLPLLQQQARFVVGADIDLAAAKCARAELRGDDGHVVVADARQLPFADHSFDVVTSFETLEHIHDRDKFLAELARVLTPAGRCIVSTPNAKITLPINGKPRNPFHVHEYEPDEFRSEMSNFFPSFTVLGQHLDPRFSIPPFWHEQQQLLKQPGMRKQVILWRALNKVPFAGLRDQLSRAVWGHQFLPNETDYQFSESQIDTASVLVAVCSNAS